MNYQTLYFGSLTIRRNVREKVKKVSCGNITERYIRDIMETMYVIVVSFAIVTFIKIKVDY